MQAIINAIETSIKENRTVEVTVSGVDISEVESAVFSAIDGDCDSADLGNGVYDVWSTEGESFRLTVTIEA